MSSVLRKGTNVVNGRLRSKEQKGLNGNIKPIFKA